MSPMMVAISATSVRIQRQERGDAIASTLTRGEGLAVSDDEKTETMKSGATLREQELLGRPSFGWRESSCALAMISSLDQESFSVDCGVHPIAVPARPF
jgi:hypothetical protein